MAQGACNSEIIFELTTIKKRERNRRKIAKHIFLYIFVYKCCLTMPYERYTFFSQHSSPPLPIAACLGLPGFIKCKWIALQHFSLLICLFASRVCEQVSGTKKKNCAIVCVRWNYVNLSVKSLFQLVRTLSFLSRPRSYSALFIYIFLLKIF